MSLQQFPWNISKSGEVLTYILFTGIRPVFYSNRSIMLRRLIIRNAQFKINEEGDFQINEQLYLFVAELNYISGILKIIKPVLKYKI